MRVGGKEPGSGNKEKKGMKTCMCSMSTGTSCYAD